MHNENRCTALTKSKIQCKNHSKNGSLCGKHSKIQDKINLIEIIENISPQKVKIYKNMANDISDIKKMTLKKLKQLVYEKGWNINFTKRKNSVCEQIIQLLEQEKKYEKDIQKIIKCQAIFRGQLLRKQMKERKMCINQEDFYSMNHLIYVDNIFFIKIIEENRCYGFDIRSINKWINECYNFWNKPAINPYTMLPLSKENITLINNLKTKLEQEGIWKELNEGYVCDETKQLEHDMVRVFQKFDALDHYTDHLWFKYLSMNDLKHLYIEAQKLWLYRANLSSRQKRRLRHNGIAFEINGGYIKRLNHTDKNKQYLQKILLHEFEAFADEGVNSVEKRLGSRLMLCALTLVSMECANAYPYLLWSLS